MRDLINRYPHCDPRILHSPGQCKFCDLHPEWQELRDMWQIAFTGQEPKPLEKEAWRTDGPVLPCPADFIRGDNHTRWGGNVAYPENPTK